MSMLIGSKSGGESSWRKALEFAQSYVRNVFSVYLDFAGPLLLIMVVSQVHVNDDKERFGLGWLYTTSLKDDRLREEKFPAYEPTTALERRRVDAANAIEYAASAV